MYVYILCVYVEYICFPSQSQEERDHKKTLEEINQVLLRNILPKHVADHFLGQSNQVCCTTAAFSIIMVIAMLSVIGISPLGVYKSLI